MKSIISATLAVLATATAFAEQRLPVVTTANGEKKKVEWTPELRKQFVERRLGGFLLDVRKQKGRIVLVNAQKSADEQWLKEVAGILAGELMVTVEVAPGKFDFKKPEPQGEASVFVVDDPSLPVTLIAPESRWSVCNVAALRSDKIPFFKARVMKTVLRAVVPLLGGADSQYPMCVMKSVARVEDLDQFPAVQLPVDVVDRLRKNMETFGISPYKRSNYYAACNEGWAPAPTNRYQQAIWDKAHELPAKPITIKYDPKRDK